MRPAASDSVHSVVRFVGETQSNGWLTRSFVLRNGTVLSVTTRIVRQSHCSSTLFPFRLPVSHEVRDMRKTKSFDAAFCHELSIWEPAPHAETEDTNEDTTDAGMCYLLCRTDHWRWNSALRPLEYAETSTSLLVPSGQCQAQLPHVMFCTTLKVSPASTRLSPDLSARRGVAARNRTAKTAAVPWSEREKHVEFSNSEGNTLVGDVVESASSDTVVLCHGHYDAIETRICFVLSWSDLTQKGYPHCDSISLEWAKVEDR